MEEIKKYQNDEWSVKMAGDDFSAPHAIDYSNKVDDALSECEDILNRISLSIEYTSIKGKMAEIITDGAILANYVGWISTDIYGLIDTKLKEGFTKKATETVSKINADDCITNNLDENDTISAKVRGVNVQQKRPSLKFKDFMLENNDVGGFAREEFAKLFKVQYDNAVASSNIKDDVSYNEYVEMLIKQGTFNHKVDTPVLSFISDLLDVTIVKPIIEAITGEDLITKDDLSGIERGFKLGMAVIDIVTLGQAGIFKGGLKAGTKDLLKSMGVEFLSNGAALTMNKAGEMLNIPAPIVFLLSLGAGYTVSRVGTKCIVKNAKEEIVYSTSYQLTNKNIRKILEENGFTVDDFLELLRVDRELTSGEKEIVNSIRDQIGFPAGGDKMAKVIPECDIDKYLSGEYNAVGGFVSKAEYSGGLSGFDAIYEGNRLDYDGTLFNSSNKTYGIIKYDYDVYTDIEIPRYGTTKDNFPYSGKGFTASQNIVLLEYKQAYKSFENGNILEIHDSITGEIVKRYKWRNGEWILIK